MNSVSSEITIHASREQVWSILANLGDVYQYSENVKFSKYISPATSGVGAARKCDLPGNAWVNEQAIAWKDQRGYTLAITEGEGLGPLDKMEVSFELSDAAEGTKVRQTMAYNMKGGIFRPLLNALASGQMRKGIQANLNGLKTFVETQ